jgi:hypothetical protein
LPHPPEAAFARLHFLVVTGTGQDAEFAAMALCKQGALSDEQVSVLTRMAADPERADRVGVSCPPSASRSEVADALARTIDVVDQDKGADIAGALLRAEKYRALGQARLTSLLTSDSSAERGAAVSALARAGRFGGWALPQLKTLVTPENETALSRLAASAIAAIEADEVRKR